MYVLIILNFGSVFYFIVLTKDHIVMYNVCLFRNIFRVSVM
jgi:hypothetical protein